MGATALLHDVEAETLQITRFRKVGGRKSHAFAGLRTAPATHRARNCKYHVFMQNAAKRRFWDHTMGGGVVANREPGSYIANWVIIYHLPPIRGTRNNYWSKEDFGRGNKKEERKKNSISKLWLKMWGGSHEYHLEYPPGNKSISHQTGKPESLIDSKFVFWGPGHGTIPRRVPSLKLTVRPLKIDPLKRRILLETIFRCYVSFGGVTLTRSWGVVSSQSSHVDFSLRIHVPWKTQGSKARFKKKQVFLYTLW